MIYPGAAEHQHLLRGIAAHYAGDPRVLAVCVFGSLGRGTWDQYSDLDLDVVLADGVVVDAPAEATALCVALGEEPAVVVRDRDDAADVVLASLMMLSVRYHPLQNTNPNIVDSLVKLAGPLDQAAIVAAGLANRRPPPDLRELVSVCVRHAVTVDLCLHRQHGWVAYQILHEARTVLLRLCAASRGAVRPYHTLDAGVGEDWLRDRFAATLSEGTLDATQEAFVALLDLLELNLPLISAGTVDLSPAERDIVRRLRARQAALDLRGS
jgi:predicted nucleotidyltransferase